MEQKIGGVIAARTYNATGLAGIAGGWQSQAGVRLIGLRVVSDDVALVDQQRAADAINYLTWLRQRGHVVVANMSFVIIGTDTDLSLFKGAVDAARNAGVIMVAGSGNYDREPRVAELLAPARWLGVLAIGASQDGETLQAELRSQYSMYDFDEQKLLAVAPVDKSPTLDIVSTLPGNQYTSVFDGTSAASAIVAGVTALVLSLNPSLTHQQISTIFASTAEKIGNYTYDSSGRTLEVGYGRINAYQALLLTHAYSNISMAATATSFNNGRRLIRTQPTDSRYHLVFESGIISGGQTLYEVYYRRSNSGGTSWETTERLSAGNEQNRLPSIAERTPSGSTIKLYVVWQRKTGTNAYDILFHHFNGNSWETIRTISSITCGYDPIPVIAVNMPSAGPNHDMMVAYRTSTGLKSRRSTSANGSTWGGETLITSSTSARNPSLTYRNVSPANFEISWDNGSSVYYRRFDGTNWVAEVEVGSVAPALYREFSSFTVNTTNDRHIAWQATDPSQGYRKVIYHNLNLNPTVYAKFYSATNHYSRPSAAAVQGGPLLVFWDESNANKIRYARYIGGSWQGIPAGTVYANNGVNASAAVTNPPSSPIKVIYRSPGSSAPYTLAFGAGIQKESSSDEIVYSRQLVYAQEDGSQLMLRLYAPYLTGEEVELVFPEVVDKDSMAAESLADKLTFDFSVPSKAEKLETYAEVFAVTAGELLQQDASTLQVDFEITDAATNNQLTTTRIASVTLNDTFKTVVPLTVPLSTFRGANVRLRPVLAGLDVAKTAGALIHVFGPDEFGLMRARERGAQTSADISLLSLQAQPNPFNPSTHIRFSLPRGGAISLRIFDVNGRAVRSWRNTEYSSGEHAVLWNGKDDHGTPVTSGAYFVELLSGRERKVAKMLLVR